MRNRCAMLVLALLASCSEEEQLSMIAKMTSKDLYEKGANCQGFHFRIENKQMIMFGDKEPRAIGRDISLSEKDNTVVMTDNGWGKLSLISVYTFSDDRTSVRFTDLHYSPQPTEEEWRMMDQQAGGNAKAKFQAFRDSLKDMPPMEFCQRTNAS